MLGCVDAKHSPRLVFFILRLVRKIDIRDLRVILLFVIKRKTDLIIYEIYFV